MAGVVMDRVSPRVDRSLSGQSGDSRWKGAIPFVVFGLLTALVAFLGGLISSSTTDSDWYRELDKPSFNPPGWVFGPVWTALYAMMALAAGLVWRKGSQRRDVRFATVLFGVQLVLNWLWTFLFFGLRSPLSALFEIVALWLAIIAWHQSAARIDGRTRWLILPYVAWVSFAAVLNASIWWMNRG
jgi:translocator protein